MCFLNNLAALEGLSELGARIRTDFRYRSYFSRKVVFPLKLSTKIEKMLKIGKQKRDPVGISKTRRSLFRCQFVGKCLILEQFSFPERSRRVALSVQNRCWINIIVLAKSCTEIKDKTKC